MINFIKYFHKIIITIEEIFMIVPTIIIVVLVISQVIARYVFGSGIMWSDELIGFLMVSIGMAGAAAAVREKKHTDLQVLINKAPKRCAKVMNMIANSIVAGFLCMLFVSGIMFALNAKAQTAIMLGIPMYIPYSLLPMGAFLMISEYILTKLNFVNEEKN